MFDTKRKFYLFAIPLIIILGFIVFYVITGIKNPKSITITYPHNLTVYPKDIAPPAFAWKDDNPKVKKWKITVRTGESVVIDKFETSQKSWKPTVNEWNSIVASGSEKKHTVTIQGITFGFASDASVTFSVSDDPVDASVFFRSVQKCTTASALIVVKIPILTFTYLVYNNFN